MGNKKSGKIIVIIAVVVVCLIGLSAAIFRNVNKSENIVSGDSTQKAVQIDGNEPVTADATEKVSSEVTYEASAEAVKVTEVIRVTKEERAEKVEKVEKEKEKARAEKITEEKRAEKPKEETGELDLAKARELFVTANDVYEKWFVKPEVSQDDSLTNSDGRVYRAVTEGFNSKSQLKEELKKYFDDVSCDHILDKNYIERDGKLYFSVLGMGFPGVIEVTGDAIEKNGSGWTYKIYYDMYSEDKKTGEDVYEKNIKLVDGNYVFEDFYIDASRFKFEVSELIENSKKETIKLTSELQEKLNLFISGFSVAAIDSFENEPDADNAVKYALDYNFRNHMEKFEKLDEAVTWGTYPYNYRIKSSIVHEKIENSFYSVQIDEEYGKNKENYSDGYYYYLLIGGGETSRMSIVTSVANVGDDVYKVEFNRYIAQDNVDDMYGYSDEQMYEAAETLPYIKANGKGTAYIKAADINDADEYLLMSYYYTES